MGKGENMLETRPLLEHNISMETDPNQTLVNWCVKHCTFEHKASEEFIFWVPPLDGNQEYLKETYGEEIPQEIHNALFEAINKNAEMDDSGYLLIAFV